MKPLKASNSAKRLKLFPEEDSQGWAEIYHLGEMALEDTRKQRPLA